jgi:hypothetical protein
VVTETDAGRQAGRNPGHRCRSQITEQADYLPGPPKVNSVAPSPLTQALAATSAALMRSLISSRSFCAIAAYTRITTSSVLGMSTARIAYPSSSSCDSVWARRVIRSSRAATSTAPTCRQRASAAWKPGRRSSLPLATSEYSAIKVQPWMAAKARTQSCCASSPRPL